MWVWVNASAGTGKTKILIDRVLRLLLENKRNILCLTFTNAAANEMENRIHSTLSAPTSEHIGVPKTFVSSEHTQSVTTL